MQMVLRILPMSANSLTARWYTSVLDYVFDGQGEILNQTARTTSLLMYMERLSLPENLLFLTPLDKYFIVRIAWVFGVNGKQTLITIMLNVEDSFEVVCCQLIRLVQFKSHTDPCKTSCIKDMKLEIYKYGYYHAIQ